MEPEEVTLGTKPKKQRKAKYSIILPDDSILLLSKPARKYIDDLTERVESLLLVRVTLNKEIFLLKEELSSIKNENKLLQSKVEKLDKIIDAILNVSMPKKESE